MKHLHPSHERVPTEQLNRQARRWREIRRRLEAAAAAPDVPQNAALLEAHHRAQRDRYARQQAAQGMERPASNRPQHRRRLKGDPPPPVHPPGHCRRCGVNLAETAGRSDPLYCGQNCAKAIQRQRRNRRPKLAEARDHGTPPMVLPDPIT